MGQNKITIDFNKTYNNDNIFVNNTGYCTKCLRELGEDRVKDHEGNEFCDHECKVDFYLEIKQDIKIFKNNE